MHVKKKRKETSSCQMIHEVGKVKKIKNCAASLALCPPSVG